MAGLRTRAELKGDRWVVNGLKIWTSGAQFSDYGVILCRTDPDVSKYRGMTLFFIDMRPIKQMDGGSHFVASRLASRVSRLASRVII